MKHYVMSQDQADFIFNYLATKPYGEVSNVIVTLQSMVELEVFNKNVSDVKITLVEDEKPNE